MTEARVPHDPADLRTAAKLVRKNIGWWPQKSIDEYNAWADRLEAWADLAPLEAAVLDAAKAWKSVDLSQNEEFCEKGYLHSAADDAAQERLIAAVRALQEATDA
jgi:hypothetical protein